MENPHLAHWKAMLRVLRYLKGIIGHGLMFKLDNSAMYNKVVVVSYTDADWGGDVSDRRSIYGHYLLLNGISVVWISKKQHVVARSSVEVEYRVNANAICEVL